METVSHDGRETAYRLTQPDGDGPTMLYIHGSGGNHRVWAPQFGPEGPAHPAVSLDLSGHGESDDIDTEAGEETLDEYVADVTAVAEETDADVLVGNSLGGAVVLQTLLTGQYTPAGAILAGTGAKLTVHERIRTLLAEDYDGLIEFLHEDSRLLYRGKETLVERSIEAMREAGQSVTERDFLSCHTFDVRDRLATVDVPALAVVGEYDNLTPPAYHEYLVEEMPDCEIVTIEDAAHLAMIEQPDAFNSELGAFIERQIETE